MQWYAVRHVYLFGEKPSRKNKVFEERIICVRAKTTLEAHKKARKIAKKYARDLGKVLYPVQIGYEMDPGRMRDGSEVWSALYNSPKTLRAFYKERYRDPDHDPNW
jgi:hypothetical protein